MVLMETSRPRLDELAKRFRQFADLECRGSSPLYEHVSRRVAEDAEVLSLMADADELQQRPNLLFAAVHFLLFSGTKHPLTAFYATMCDEPAPAPPHIRRLGTSA